VAGTIGRSGDRATDEALIAARGGLSASTRTFTGALPAVRYAVEFEVSD
jgi:hypothetical protein